MSFIVNLFSKKQGSTQNNAITHLSSNPEKKALEDKINSYRSALTKLTNKLRENNEFLGRVLDCELPDPIKLNQAKASIANQNTVLATRISNCQTVINQLENQRDERTFSHTVFEATK
jgi:hypothetical protein